MSLSLLIAASMAQAIPSERPCGLIFPVAPDEAAARRIAEAVIAGRPHPPRRRYVLHVRRDGEDPSQWIASQGLPPPRRRPPPGSIYVRAGGGGLGMRIDRCTGAVSRLHYQR